MEPDKVEEKSSESEAYREWYNTRRLNIVSKGRARYKRYERKKYQRKKKKLRVPLEIGEDVLLLSSRIKKKSDPGKFYKSSVDNKSFFYKKTIFTIIKKSNIDNKAFYWIKNKENNKKILFRVCLTIKKKLLIKKKQLTIKKNGNGYYL